MLYLSQAIGRPVRDRQGEPIGKVADLIVAIGDRYPPVTGLVVATGRRRIFLPWTHVAEFEAHGVTLGTHTIDIDKFEQRPNELLLYADLQDKQIVDIDGRKVVRVNDLRLDEIEGKLHLVAVDVGPPASLRRLGVEGPFRTLARNLRLPHPERYIDWEDVDPVETSIASIRLRVPHEGLRELHPADLASIIDQLAPRDRAGILAALDDEAAADAIEEMEPETQVEVLEDLAPERAADILEEMSPDDAADLVADLSEAARRDPAADGARRGGRGAGAARLPRGLGRRHHDHRVHRHPGDLTAAETIDRLRELEPDAETIYYVYVVDDDGRLVGVLSLRDLIVARPDTLVRDFMFPEPVAVGVLAPQDEVAQVVARYNLLAVPVVDDDGRLVGIVTVDDAIDTVLPTAWKRRLPKLFSPVRPRCHVEAAAGNRPLGDRRPPGPRPTSAPRAARTGCGTGSASGSTSGPASAAAAPSRSWPSWARGSSPASWATTRAASPRTPCSAPRPASGCCGSSRITIVILAVVQEMAARLGVVTGQGLSDLIRDRFGVRWTVFAMVILLVANIANTVAEFAGASASLELFGVSRLITVPVVAVAIWALVLFASYRTVERVFLSVSLVFLTYIASAFLARPDWAAVTRGLTSPTLDLDTATCCC